ncbi:MAG: hypothetical protein ACLVEU_15240 [Bacteroides cellulosilyticus]
MVRGNCLVNLRDDQYPVDVTLHYVKHQRKKMVSRQVKSGIRKETCPAFYIRLCMLYFNNSTYSA